MEGFIKKYGKYFLSIGILSYIALSIIFKHKSCIDNMDLAITITLIIASLYINLFWKINILDRHPKVYGKYLMTFVSSFNDAKKDIEVVIRQNLLSTRIYMSSDESSSVSINSNINLYTDYSELIYTYFNEPNILERNHSDIHYGTCKFKILNNKIISGEYYTSRQTAGQIVNIRKI